VHQPYLTGRSRTGRNDEGGKIVRLATPDVHALAADADDVIVGNRPILARTAIARYIEHRRAFGRCASLHIETEPAYPGDLAVAEYPLLISPGITGLIVPP
jgi:hypothetical protein